MKGFSLLKLASVTSIMLFTAQVYAQDTTNTTETKTQKNMETHRTHTTTTTTDANQALTPEQDAKITKTVKELLERSKTVSKGLAVTTTNGVVQISGNVDSDSDASSAVELASSVVGVRDVDTSNLTVQKSQQPFADTMITAKVKGLFIREELFGQKDIPSLSIMVETKNGVVYLTGEVSDKQQINDAIDIIKKNVAGVKKVEYRVQEIMGPNGTPSNNKQR